MELAAVLWDMDGTLVDSEKLWDYALYAAAEWLGGTLPEEQRLQLVGSNMGDTARFLLDVTGRPVDDSSVAEVSVWIRDRMVEEFSNSLPWRPGAEQALLDVRAAGVPSALVTSTQRLLTERALDSIGREYFAATVCGDEVGGRNKPDPEPYLRAARLLGVDPRRCVAVEDSWIGARSAAGSGCAVMVVPCDLPVPASRQWVQRDSLVGVDASMLAALLEGGVESR